MSTDRASLVETLVQVDRLGPGLAESDAVICMSGVLAEACQSVGVPEDRIVVLGNRVGCHRFYPRPQPDYDPALIRALFIGRLQEQKNVHGAAAAMALLRQRGWRVHLDVCGGRGINGYLRRALAVLHRDEWTYHGAVGNRDLPRLFARADMYVGPSFFEGFQIPLIEALASGRPCVASNQPPADEIIDPTLGALVDPGDPSSIADGIEQVKRRLNEPAAAAALRQACRVAALRRWDYFAVSQAEVDVYARVVARVEP